MTLCGGQGGTPADSTQRGYHNSWRIVEMAAEAGLVLSHVHPFTLSSYPGYVPTGYRGAGKGFVLDGALEHTFTLPQLDDCSWTKRDADTFYDVCQYCCEGVSSGDLEVHIQATGLSEFLHCLLLSLPWHQVTRTHRVLLRALRQLEQGLWSGVWSEVSGQWGGGGGRGGGEGEREREQAKGEGGVDGERGVKREGVVGNRGSVEGERVSVCYRMEYSSAGEALSRSVARELQLRVRERLTRQVEGLELR